MTLLRLSGVVHMYRELRRGEDIHLQILDDEAHVVADAFVAVTASVIEAMRYGVPEGCEIVVRIRPARAVALASANGGRPSNGAIARAA